MAKNVRRHSRVLTDLPADLRAEVDRLLLEPGITYDDVVEHVASKGYDISRSSIGRYGKDYLENYQNLKIAIDQAKALKGNVGEGLALEEAVANLSLLKAMELFQAGSIAADELPKYMSAAARMQTSSIKREQYKAEVESEIRNRTLQDAAETAQKTAKSAGATDEMIERIRADILGIGAPA